MRTRKKDARILTTPRPRERNASGTTQGCFWPSGGCVLEVAALSKSCKLNLNTYNVEYSVIDVFGESHRILTEGLPDILYVFTLRKSAVIV